MSQTLVQDVTAALGLEDVTPLIQGGQKIVLKCTLSGAEAVAKIVLVSNDPNGRITSERAHREVELLSTVDSPRVVKVLTDAVEIGDPTEAVCWVEEYLDGQDVRQTLNTIWSEDDVWTLLGDIAVALEACHELDVVHRDLSAGNVRKTADGRFVLMDPGLARHLERTAITGHFQPGTPGWRSPEHVPGGEPSPASDIFALGILAFYALTGGFPVDPNGAPGEYDRRLTDEQAAPIKSVAAGVSDQLAQVIDTCLQRQPARRFLDGRELRERIATIRGES
ncbi:serine/threonine-protein kinase [Aeromicrobium chenweiae]|uniref:non-specific serine/threonine protein kinase n=1 Tax=Aeromicrobium chenweiae TaxID=2079793 RepID=A0A2S0WHS0_9ACTN|nr:serine/threonine-protein kinase [Aeromicrobium chenweiae]AWB90867.1 hypothetical protein C3E78_00705 [Aeromicrobium chenweiae]TGN32086.1 serine/threonine protein kinase [Aeromicrobium chenweiae]